MMGLVALTCSPPSLFLLLGSLYLTNSLTNSLYFSLFSEAIPAKEAVLLLSPRRLMLLLRNHSASVPFSPLPLCSEEGFAPVSHPLPGSHPLRGMATPQPAELPPRQVSHLPPTHSPAWKAWIDWKYDVKRFEALKIILYGNAEFEAKEVVLQGDHRFEFPDGYRMCVTQDSAGFAVKVDPISNFVLVQVILSPKYLQQLSGLAQNQQRRLLFLRIIS